MRMITIWATVIIAFTFLSACGNGESSSDKNISISEEEENEVFVNVDGEEWSTTNVTLAGSDVFGMTADSRGTYGITVDLGYNLEGTGLLTNRCEYTQSGKDQDDMAWADEECSIEVTALTEEKIEGNFSFRGESEDGSQRSVSGSFRVERSGMM